MIVKLDHFPKDRGENQKILDLPPPSFWLWLITKPPANLPPLGNKGLIASFDGRDHKETVLFVIKASHRVHHLSLVGRFGRGVVLVEHLTKQYLNKKVGK